MQIGKIPPFLPIERAIMTVSAQNLVWIDMEMTGLDPEQNVVLEIATIVTDKDLNVLAEGPVIAIHQSDEELAKRRAEQDKLGWKPAQPRPRKVSAALKAYAKLVMSADKGAVRDLSLLD